MKKTETMKDSWTEAWERSERKHRELQEQILAIAGSERVLQKLAKAGLRRSKVLALLADAVLDRTFWVAPLRRTKRELESVARQLEMAANRAEKVSLDAGSYVSPWLAVMGLGKWQDVRTPKELAPRYIFGFMRLYAKNCREKATAFGNLLKTHPPRQQREMIDCLLLEVWLTTRKYHDKEVAFLLTNAFEAAGRKRDFTEDQIKKHRQRYVVPRIMAYRRSHPATPIPAKKGDTLPPQDSC